MIRIQIQQILVIKIVFDFKYFLYTFLTKYNFLFIFVLTNSFPSKLLKPIFVKSFLIKH